MRRLAISLIVLAMAVTAGLGLFLWAGLYDISATQQHTQVVYGLLEKTMHQSVRRRARDIAVPPLADMRLQARGALCYQQKCLQCHGGPGVAQAEIGRSMQPLPGPLVDAREKWRPAELYWITRHGIKMSGMPAWQHHMADQDLWAVVAFLQQLPNLDAAGFGSTMSHASARTQAGEQCRANTERSASSSVHAALRQPDPERGRQTFTQHACSACHVIPGVTGADVAVGPPLAHYGRQQFIAGELPLTHEHLVRWIQQPQAVDPHTTMPDLMVNAQDAHDMAAYLMTLK